MTKLIKLAVLSNLLITLPAAAKDKEPVVAPSVEELALESKKLYAFLDEYFEGMTAEMDTILKDEGEATYKAVYTQQMAIYDHYHLMFKSGGQKLADLVVEQNKMFKELTALLAAYEELAPDDPKRVEARAKAEPLLAKSNTFGGEWAKVQLEGYKGKKSTKLTERNIGHLKDKIKKMDALRKDPKKIFDDYIVYRETTIKKAIESKKNLPEHWHTDPKKALAAAKKSGKPVHVFFSTAWCVPCKAMVKDVYPSEDVKKALSAYEPLYLDGDQYNSFAQKYRVNMYPSFITMDADGKLLRRSEANSMNKEDFMVWLTAKK